MIEGNLPIKFYQFSIGNRVPLGFGAAGMALLAEHDDEELERVLKVNAHEIQSHGRYTVEYLRRAVMRTRERGFAVTSSVYTPGVGSIGGVIRHFDGKPIYAINVSVVGDDRFTASRVDQLQSLLKTELARLAC
jgi:DNA-binding IclR family transcriptional regulator